MHCPGRFLWSVRGSAPHDLAGLQAGGAHLEALPLRDADLGPYGLDVRVPPAVVTPVGVRDRHAEAGPLATDVANGSHVRHSLMSPEITVWTVTVGTHRTHMSPAGPGNC